MWASLYICGHLSEKQIVYCILIHITNYFYLDIKEWNLFFLRFDIYVFRISKYCWEIGQLPKCQNFKVIFTMARSSNNVHASGFSKYCRSSLQHQGLLDTVIVCIMVIPLFLCFTRGAGNKWVIYFANLPLKFSDFFEGLGGGRLYFHWL